MLLAEVIGIGEKRGAERDCGARVVSAGMSEKGVALPGEGLTEKLAELAEPYDGDLEASAPIEEI